MQNIKFNNYMPTKNNIVKIYIPPELTTYGEEFINNVMMDVCHKMNDPRYDKIMVPITSDLPYEEFNDKTTDEIYEYSNPLYKLKRNDINDMNDMNDIIIHIDDVENNIEINNDKQNITIVYLKEINDDLNKLIL